MLQQVMMQAEGGTTAAIKKGIALVTGMLEQANSYASGSKCRSSHLIVGLNCGGSDGYSGITANPALGGASDMLISQRWRRPSSRKRPEIYGAEHLLTRRAASPEIANGS
jgi:altronate hydrolase